MNWETCKSFGLTEVRETSVILYYDRYNYRTVQLPNLYMMIDSVIWQGNSLIVRGTERDGTKRVYIFSDFCSYHQIL